MMHAAKSNRSSSHQYKKIPVKPESDSEDDEAILYTASSLNEHSSSKNSQYEFGVGVYDYGRDLDLPLVHNLPERKNSEVLLRGRYATARSVFTVSSLVVLLMIAVGAAIGIIVLANKLPNFTSPSSFPSSSSSLHPEPSCTPVPQPLPNMEVQPCSTPSQQPHVAETVPLKEPTQLPPPAAVSDDGDPLPTSEMTSDGATTTTKNQPQIASLSPAPVISDDPLPTVKIEAAGNIPTTQTAPLSSSPPETSDVPTEEANSMISTSEIISDGASNDQPQTDDPLPTVKMASDEAAGNIPTTQTAPLTSSPPETSDVPTEEANSMISTRPSSTDDEPLPISPISTSATTTSQPAHNDEGASIAISDNKSLFPSSPVPSCYPVPTPLPSMAVQPCHGQAKETPLPPVLPPGPTTTDHPTTASVQQPPPPPPPSPGSFLKWERNFFPGITESSAQVFDLDGDGRDEVVIVEDFSQCIVRVLVLDGRDGSTVWEREVPFPVFAVRCVLDVNMDGARDCLVSGRTGGLSALDGTNGELLWAVDRSIVFPTYNFYFPLILSDMNGDGVDDIVNIHGGDSRYHAEDHVRSPAFLVAVSGKTGEKLIEPIAMPDGHESYTSPVLFKLNNDEKKEFILFGSGGETVGGSLWAMEVKSLRMKVIFFKTRAITSKKDDYVINLNDTYHACLLDIDKLQRPVFNETRFDLNRVMKTTSIVHSQCPSWANKEALWNDYNVCLYEIVRSGSPKGVVLPPVMADMNGDGVYDLVVSMFEGRTLVLDGVDMTTVIWEANYPGTESYSLPAPFYYTTDNIPDLIIRTNVGEWSDYNSSTIRVLDGSNGHLLWKFDSSHSGMMSAISLASKTHGRDALIFISIGVPEKTTADSRRRRGAEFQTEQLDLAGEAEEISEPFHDDGDGGDDDGDEVDEIHENEFKYKEDHIVNGLREDPPELWVSTPDDPLPSDLNDVEAMLKYCGRSTTDAVSSIYMVTREMIESGMEVIPLVSYNPLIYIKGPNSTLNHTHSVRRKRHGPGMESHNQQHTDSSNDEMGLFERKNLRCGHISNPTYIFTTPLLGDFNLDGRLDITYNIVWSSSEYTAPRYLVAASDLEKLFEEAYGSEILDFGNFLPLEDQSWTQYMGSRGDNVFRLPKG